MAEISDYLNGLDEQEISEEAMIKLVNDPKVSLLCEKYVDWLDNYPKTYSDVDKKDVFFGLIRGNDFTVKDIRKFSILLKRYEQHKYFECSGLFLSALINNSEEDNFEIITTQVCKKINFVGSKNNKNLTVIGDLGNDVGLLMNGGTLTVKGNTELRLGRFMKKGKIIVNGYVKNLGLHSEGGEIYVEGRIGYFSKTGNSKVYQNGVLIWPK